MALESVTQPAPRELYACSAKYVIAPESSNRDLKDDASCFLNSAIATINTIAIELEVEGSQIQENPAVVASMLWGVFHQLGMVKGMVDAVQVVP